MLRCGRYTLSLLRPQIMGIVNVTPDSFSDGGTFFDSSRAIEHGLQLLEEGADILDIGGESTRPGAAPVSSAEEMDRVLPVLEGLSSCGAPLSVDTLKPEVMRAAIQAGADMLNDVNAMQAEGAIELTATANVAICLMHMRGEPRTMQQDPVYHDVVAEVKNFLTQRLNELERAGIARDRLVIDPGFGFGKTLRHNLALFRDLDQFSDLGVPVMAGLSRKSMLGNLTGLPVENRLIPSISAAVLAAVKGAKILRVHDIKETRQALQIFNAVEDGNGNH